ncbi:MAG: hypothetical protein SPL80_04990 [Bacilli bacterium]|nr:hypothetical protein [Bacilli bacterium]
MKKLTKMLLPLVALFALTGCDDGLTPATPSVTPSAEPSSVAPTKSIDTKDGKRYAVTQTETYSLKDNLVLTGLTFDQLEVKLSNPNIADYADGVLTRKKYGTVTASIGEKDSIFGINLNVTFLPANAFNATYKGVGSTDTYAGMNVEVKLTSEKNAKITYSGTYKNDAGADVQVEEKTLEGAYAEKSYGDVTTNMLLYVVNVPGLEEKPQFAFIGIEQANSISIRIGKLPLAEGLTFTANCAMALK